MTRRLLPFLIALPAAVLLCGAAVLLIRRTDLLLLPLSPDLSAVFASLRRASIRPHPLLPFLLSAGSAASFLRARRRKIWLLPGAILALTAFLAAIVFSEVNGVVFAAVLRALTGHLLSGALDAL